MAEPFMLLLSCLISSPLLVSLPTDPSCDYDHHHPLILDLGFDEGQWKNGYDFLMAEEEERIQLFVLWFLCVWGEHVSICEKATSWLVRTG
ncbi:hypothetical protein RchiOBHm_Chr7g0198331 [Rosa chinensis]|uniref:Uncharacterized protein n=1 Tax=Rosa chinensis TaxID=74649 RepID=A0A2P6P751_ROSCH|nr:hypothetical protein RchiOBHm_Chr7g0198331 [Rosa chinensis]